MLQISRILFPTDFSESAESAFTHALHLAKAYGATIHVLNVAVPVGADASGPMRYLDLEEDTDGTWSDAYRGAALHHDVQVVHALKRATMPARGILDYADAHDVDLIAMGMHGRQGLVRWFIGSTAEEVVRLASCPVLTVHGGAPLDGASIRRILVPVDFSESSRESILYAKELAGVYDARIDLLHVVEDLAHIGVHHAGPVPLFVADVSSEIVAAIDGLMKTTPGSEADYEVHVVADHPAHGILGFAEAREADLIVLTTHGSVGLGRLLAGGTTEKVLRTAPCPVFTAKGYGKPLVVEEVKAEPIAAKIDEKAASDAKTPP